MTRWVNLAAALLIIVGNIWFWTEVSKPRPRPEPERFEIKGKVYYKDRERPPASEPIGALVIAALGSAVLFVDAIRRPRGPSKVASYITTLLGIVFLGIPALLYYAMIGWRPVGETDVTYGRGFCRQCVASTTNESAGNTFSVNFFWGTRFLGGSSRCKTCGSQVKTKWICAGVPLIPQGSYRVIPVEYQRYISRKTDLNATHVAIVYGIAAGVALISFALYALIKH